MSAPRDRIRNSISACTAAGRTALIPFITAGYPDPARFVDDLRAIASVSDVIEVGVPFSNPLADGPTIQRSSRLAIEAGVSLRWILEQLAGAGDIGAPLVLMSYLNPLFVYGYEALAADAAAAGICGFIVPDLPLEESQGLRDALEPRGLALIPLVTPITAQRRLAELCAQGHGFVYAVTVTGITGGARAVPAQIGMYLERVRAAANGLPVCAGFGIRDAEQVTAIGRHADGVVVGTALVEVMAAGRDPAQFLLSLRSMNPADGGRH